VRRKLQATRGFSIAAKITFRKKGYVDPNFFRFFWPDMAMLDKWAWLKNWLDHVNLEKNNRDFQPTSMIIANQHSSSGNLT
jgi:hypothetical protein